MRSPVVWVYIGGIALIVVGLALASSPWGAAIAVAGFVLLTGLAIVTNIRASRTRGHTWVVKPGAAHREAVAEREAQERAAAKRDRP